MRNTFIIAFLTMICAFGCTTEKKNKDRREASDMFNRICKLTKEYTEKLTNAQDSSAWASLCTEFEDKLDKVSFSYSPDTDLLLTEGQNDTIHSLMLEYIKTRNERIHEILHPIAELDSLSVDSALEPLTAAEINQSSASHNHGN